MAHAVLFGDALGCDVFFVDDGDQSRHVERTESVVAAGLCYFGCKTLSSEVACDHVTDLYILKFGQDLIDESTAADEPAVFL